MTRNKFEIDIIGEESSKKLVLYEIEESARKGKTSLGQACGLDIGHCVYLGARHRKDFENKAKWYYIHSEDDDDLQKFRRETGQKKSIKAEFYE